MQTKPISPAGHAVIDYLLVGGLLVLPRMLGLNKKVRRIYGAEAAGLLPYVAITKTPVAACPLIPFAVHGTIDPFNVAAFAVQTFAAPFRRQKKAVLFNIGFTAIALATVLLTDFTSRE